MKKFRVGQLFGLLALLVAFASPACAQVQTWVSSSGDDSKDCSNRATPCRTFYGAYQKTSDGGEITCVDAGSYGPLTIAKSLTINCAHTYGGIILPGGLAPSSPGIAGISVSGSGILVRLKGLVINGGNVTSAAGIQISNATEVVVEDCTIDAVATAYFISGNTNGSPTYTASGGFGIADTRSASGSLGVYRTTIRNIGRSAIGVAPASGAVVVATVDKVNVYRSGAGIGIGGNVAMQIDNSSFSTGLVGVQADTGALLSIYGSVITQNNTGVVASSGSTIRIGDSSLSFNTNGSTGPFQSFVNNRFTSNGSFGTVTPVYGGVTNPQGLN